MVVSSSKTSSQLRRATWVTWAMLGGVACESVGSSNGNGTDACPAQLPEATVVCDQPGCDATEGLRTLGRAVLNRDVAERWFVVATAASDFVLNENVSVDFALGTPGALTGAAKNQGARRPSPWSREQQARIQALRNRQAAEYRVWSAALPAEAVGRRFGGTAVRVSARPTPQQQGNQCSAASPVCGSEALCVIPAASDTGTCQTEVTLNLAEFLGDPSSGAGGGVSGVRSVTAQVRAVSDEVAILVDTQDSVPDDTLVQLLDRFDRHIAPLNHSFFGRPEDQSGRDFDRNGVVILLLTSQVAQISDFGDSLVGFFFSDDLADLTDPDAPAHSNGADILYMQPPGPSISLDQLSGTIGHEYQHLINYVSKVVNAGSQQEELWLDEGLSTFAEEMLGYGEDAFDNMALFLQSASSTSLTGNGLLFGDSPDTSERRGMAALLVRYIFEQSGGAEFNSPGGVTDRGGVAVVRSLVDSADTGVDLLTVSRTGRLFQSWVEDLMLTVVLDGTSIPDVSCNPRFQFQTPTTDSFTGGQRGINLRGSVPGLGTLTGPNLDPFAATEASPLVVNGGDLRELEVATGQAQITWGTDITDDFPDLQFRLRAVPAQ